MIEAIRISRAAYPNRLPHAEFLQRFRLLSAASPSPTAAASSLGIPRSLSQLDDEDLSRLTRALLEQLLPPIANKGGESPPEGEDKKKKPRWEMGRTRVYFVKGALEELEEKRMRILAAKVRLFTSTYDRQLHNRCTLDNIHTYIYV